MDDLLVAWGKATEDGSWHPLVFHGVDTAAVAAVLWRRLLGVPVRERVAFGLGVDEDGALRWLRVLAWLHDVGKATAFFQRLDGRQASRVRAAGWDLAGGRLVAHGRVSALVIAEAISGRASRFDARELACVAGGHHGSFGAAEDPLDGLGEKRAAIAAMAVDRVGPLPRAGEVTNPALAVFGGLITLADWVASNVDWFPPFAVSGVMPRLADLDTYQAAAEGRAEGAWAELAWAAPRSSDARDRLRAMFPFIERASPMQQAAVGVAGTVAGSALCVVEDRTGSGKTEAALVLVDAFIRSGAARGAFFGLPTRATADQAYSRVAAAFAAAAERRDAVRVELVHGFAALTPAYAQLADEPLRLIDLARDEERAASAEEAVIAGGWFAQRKRGLLAPVAVGTVDQAMLAALPSRHFTLRMLGLAGKVVVLDEVHAYDVYMGAIIERLLEWLGALGCPVVLLSATLPIAARETLVAAYSTGANLRAAPGESSGYPRMTLLSGVERLDVVVPSAVERSTRVELCEENPDLVVGGVLQLALDGLDVAVIANTVARSRAWFRRFASGAASRVPVDLLHARYRLLERAAIEERVMSRYSRDGVRPGGSVVVATQVLEQSLDLDFDLVVSELAPFDLLMQRAGRSHRHRRDRPRAAGEGPWLRVLVPELDRDALPRLAGAGAARVYAEHILLRSYVALRDHLAGSSGRIVERAERSDVDALVQRVYSEADLDVSCERWKATKVGMEQERAAQSEYASSRVITSPWGEHLITDMTGEVFDEEDPRAPLPPKTRLGADPVRALLLDPEEREELARRAGPGAGRLPGALIAWLIMRTASLPAWQFRSRELVVGVDDGLARRAPALAWIHRAELGADGRGELLGVPVASDPVLGVLVGKEVQDLRG
jgi:CRISPR-associated endonuclease/helicase Cas3